MNKITALLLLLLIMPFSAHSMDPPGACALPAASEVTEVDATEEAAAAASQDEGLTASQEQLRNETWTEADAKVKNNKIGQKQLNSRQVAYSKAASRDGVYRTDGYTNIPARPGDTRFEQYIDTVEKAEPGSGKGDTFAFKREQKDAYLANINEEYKANSSLLEKEGDSLNEKTKDLISKYIDEGPENAPKTPDGRPIFSSDQGMPGYHAEVRSTNRLFNMNSSQTLEQADVATYKLTGARKNPLGTTPFKACANCSGILKPGGEGANIITDPKT